MGGDFDQPSEPAEIHITNENFEEALDTICDILESGGDVEISWNPEQ